MDPSTHKLAGRFVQGTYETSLGPAPGGRGGPQWRPILSSGKSWLARSYCGRWTRSGPRAVTGAAGSNGSCGRFRWHLRPRVTRR